MELVLEKRNSPDWYSYSPHCQWWHKPCARDRATVHHAVDISTDTCII